jgi:hypothetical protein
MFYKWLYIWKIITNYLELRKLWNHLRWFHNSEALAATLYLPSLALEPNPFAPHSWCRIRGRCPPLCQCGSGTPEPRNRPLACRRQESYPINSSPTISTPLPSLSAASHISTLALLGFVLWSMYRVVCLKLGCRPWWMAVSWAEATASRTATPSCNLASLPWMMPHHQYMPCSALKHTLPHRYPMSVTSWSFHPLWAVATYLGMIMPFLVIFASLCFHHPSRYRFDHPRAKT